MSSTLAIVTGASSGVGAGVAAAASTDATVATINRRPAGEIHLAVDLADPASWPVVAGWLDRHIGSEPWERVVLVNCAAVLQPIGFAGEVDRGGYTAAVLLDSAMPQVVGADFVAAMATHGRRGTLVQISSGAARTPYAGLSDYCAAKAAIDQWVRTVGEEQRMRGDAVKVLSVAPGVVATQMQDRLRATPDRDLPSVERFTALHDDGVLRDAAAVGAELWALAQRSDVENGSVLDIRDFPVG